MSDQPPASAGIDQSRPSIARMYDYLLGGKDHYEVDRALVDSVGKILPHPEQLARVNRSFMARAVRWLSRSGGVEQFLDCGSGLPTMENVHQVVQRYQPHGRVVYVDNDPIVAAHGRALLSDDERARFVAADFTDPARLLSEETVSRELDWDAPMALLHCATLHHVPDEQDPWAVMRTLVDALPPGSYVVISHIHDPGDEHYRQVVDSIQRRAKGSGMAVAFRGRERIADLFHGTELLEPGLVRLAEWWPEGPVEELAEPWDYLFLGAVGRKPGPPTQA